MYLNSIDPFFVLFCPYILPYAVNLILRIWGSGCVYPLSQFLIFLGRRVWWLPVLALWHIFILDILSSSLLKKMLSSKSPISPYFFLGIYIAPLVLSLGLNRVTHLFHGVCMHFCVQFSDLSVPMLIPLHPWFIGLMLFAPTGAGFPPFLSW